MAETDTLLSSYVELEKSHEYAGYPDERIVATYGVWRQQRELPERSQHSLEDVDKVLNRVKFELAMRGIPVELVEQQLGLDMGQPAS